MYITLGLLCLYKRNYQYASAFIDLEPVSCTHCYLNGIPLDSETAWAVTQIIFQNTGLWPPIQYETTDPDDKR